MDASYFLARLKRPLLYVMALSYIIAGITHFIIPEAFAQIVPPMLPYPLVLAYLSGVAEIALGVGLLSSRTRKLAAWGVIALLIVIFPANIYMAVSDVTVTGVFGWTLNPSPTAQWSRLPLQGVLILWAWWYTRSMPGK
ncbi:DoxX family protein [Natronomonas salsuginis]|uniref:DoxX family membrane protein n=1 Tax=Natronomonas salsuginis TaxID=2217661 RepID=A0A4U5JJG9_9EURY|nr:DoxX family membrane protein [Natronomonas salsuginis]TKR27887.1 DoxX family membrane protein [Natronomonas salsuginis]